jgi:AbrB family looped-hinge helix DNA binding protein
MTVTLKSKAEITVPKSVRRKAGIKPGDRLEFKVSGQAITILPKRTAEELEDYLELKDPAVREAISESNADIAAGRIKPAEDLLRSPSKRRAKSSRR